MTNYTAVFEIEHGVSKGFGVVYNDIITKSKLISAESDIEALKHAYHFGEQLVKNYLANTDGYKTATLISLKDETNSEIDQVSLIRDKSSDKEGLEDHLNILFPKGNLRLQMTWIEDMLEIFNI